MLDMHPSYKLTAVAPIPNSHTTTSNPSNQGSNARICEPTWTVYRNATNYASKAPTAERLLIQHGVRPNSSLIQ